MRSGSPTIRLPVVPEDRTPDLAADDRLFDQHLRVVLSCAFDRGQELLLLIDATDAERGTRTGRLHKDGIGKPVGVNMLVRRDGPEVRRRDSCASRDDVGKGLVHAESRTLDVAADIGDAGELQQALHRPVLAELAVENGKHHIQTDRLVVPLL